MRRRGYTKIFGKLHRSKRHKLGILISLSHWHIISQACSYWIFIKNISLLLNVDTYIKKITKLSFTYILWKTWNGQRMCFKSFWTCRSLSTNLERITSQSQNARKEIENQLRYFYIFISIKFVLYPI